MTLASYVVSLSLRAVLWILVFTDHKDSTSSRVLEFLRVFSGNLTILSLYYFTLEMEATKIILLSNDHVKFNR